MGLNFSEITQAAGYTNNYLPNAITQVSLPGIEVLDARELEEVRDFSKFYTAKRN